MKAIRKGSDASLLKQLEKGRNDGEAHLREDKQRLEESHQMTESMLAHALQNYAKALADSSEHDHTMYRFCAIWLAQLGDHHFELLHRLTPAIPSHKFVTLAYQISARLGSGTQHFADYVKKLITRMASDHPFHTLYPLHALRKISLIETSESSGRTKRKSMPVDTSSQHSRSTAAEEIWSTIRRLSSLTERIDAIDTACEAYIEWASVKLKEDVEYAAPPGPGSRAKVKGGMLPIRPSLMIMTRVRDLPIPITTFSLPVNLTGKYTAGDFPSIIRYETTFKAAGGLATPKILVCHGSDGKAYKQLVRQLVIPSTAFFLTSIYPSSNPKMTSVKTLSWSKLLVSLMSFCEEMSNLGDVDSPWSPTMSLLCVERLV